MKNSGGFPYKIVVRMNQNLQGRYSSVIFNSYFFDDDLFSETTIFPKSAIINLVVKHVKKMVPDFSLPGSYSFKNCLAKAMVG